MYLTAIFSDRPQGHRRLRFSFSLHLSKNTRLTETKKNPKNPSLPEKGAQGLEAVRPPVAWNRAVDEHYLDNPTLNVNTQNEEFRFDFYAHLSGLSVFGQSFAVRRNYSPLRLRCTRRQGPPDTF